MGIIKFENNSFYINTENSSYIMRISNDGVLIHCYYGKKICITDMSFYNLYTPYDYTAPFKVDENITTLDALPQECPSFGRGDYRMHAVRIKNGDGRGINDYRYCSHRIFSGFPQLDGLPHLDENGQSAETLEIVMRDIISGVQLSLFYAVAEKNDIIARHTVVKNNTGKTVTVIKAASASLDFEFCEFDMISLYGRWANERNIEHYPLHHGRAVISSNRGASGHHSNPFAALVKRNADEDNGEVYGIALIYSGNFKIEAEVGQFGVTRLYAGINEEDFSWNLEDKEVFISPQAVLTYSSKGFGTMSENFHSMCRTHLGACARQKKHPVVLNLWEAFYFGATEQEVIETINEVADYGIDTVVMDDGWFGRRENESTSLGDWYVNKEKFPSDFENIISLCQQKSLNFGLWFEPEMISQESNLYKEHPDWCIHMPGIEPVRSRSELVLDLSRDDVVNGIYDIISKVLKKYDISYVKWDMNRNITDNGSESLINFRQGEHAHRYILGVYRLMQKFRDEFPHIFFEGSAGGGGRFDFGILYYMPQIWTSDNSDAIGRLNIQYGTSLVYPPETMAAHVSECPNHQTGRITPIDTRGNVAQLFSLGYELNPKTLSSNEKNKIILQIAKHREFEKWLCDAKFFRLADPYKGNVCAWQAVSADKNSSVVVYVRRFSRPKERGEYLRLKGLEEKNVYKVQPLNITVPGDVLMYAGIPINMQNNDFKSILFEISAI